MKGQAIYEQQQVACDESFKDSGEEDTHLVCLLLVKIQGLVFGNKFYPILKFWMTNRKYFHKQMV